MYRQESKIMSGSPASFFLPSAIPHTMHLSYPSLTSIFSQTKHISNKPSLTLCSVHGVTIHLLFVTPSISTNQPTNQHSHLTFHFYQLPLIPKALSLPYPSYFILHSSHLSHPVLFNSSLSFRHTLDSLDASSLTQPPSSCPAFLHLLMLYPCTMPSVPNGDLTQYHRLRYWFTKYIAIPQKIRNYDLIQEF